jgi:hypothetical protein
MMEFVQGAISEGEQVSELGGVAPILRDRTGKLPASAPLGFATLSHSNLKSYAKIDEAQGHNTRAKETPNARKDAPAPIEMLEDKSGTYVERVKAILREHGQPAQDGKPAQPVKPRKGGTIACEDVYGASPEYWNRNGDWKLKRVDEIRNDPVVQAALALARKKHGPRLVSCSLHLDEESPHIHVISVPLVRRAHAKRGKKPKGTPRGPDGKFLDPRPLVEKWSLDVSSIRGLSSQLEKNHDEWARVCKPFGLVRGARGSDMTKEQRRARRNRQTGRSSKAEMEARQEREQLHADAERSRERGADYEKEAKAKADKAEADSAAAKDRREAAEAAEARARAQEAENERVRGDLAERETRLRIRESRIEEQAAVLEREATLRNDQMRLISKALDSTCPFELHDREGRPEVEGLVDERDQNASRGSWDWLTGGIASIAKLLTGLRNREAAATEQLQKAEAELERVSALQDKLAEDRLAFRMAQGADRLRIGILEKVISPTATNRLAPKDGKVTVLGLSEFEVTLLADGPAWFRASFDGFVKKMYDLAKGQADIRARENAVAKLEAEKALLASQRTEFDREQSAWNATLGRAKAFQTAWERIAPEERAPAVEKALKEAGGLTTDDLPPGYTLPGKGGPTR